MSYLEYQDYVSFVYRDPWIRLNVAPAKIMQVKFNANCAHRMLTCIKYDLIQQEHVLSELREYATSIPTPTDAPSVLKTMQYLTACHHLFERGILGKQVFWTQLW